MNIFHFLTGLAIFSGQLVGVLATLLANAALAQSVPRIGGVVATGFSATNVAAPGSALSVFGTNLVVPDTQCIAKAFPLPTGGTPCGVTVALDGKPAAFSVALSSQLTIYLPWEIEAGPGDLVVTVQGAGSSEPFEITIQDYAPGVHVYTSSSFTGPQAVATRQDGSQVSQVSPTNPAVSGDTLFLFAAGLGHTDNDPPLGDVTNETSRTLGRARVFLRLVADGAPSVAQNEGETVVETLFSGLYLGFVGVYYVEFTFPSGLDPGNYAIELEMSDPDGSNAVRSAPANLAVGAPRLTLNSVVNAASFGPGPIAAGSIVSLFGTRFGTSDNLSAFPSTEHEGLSVTFDGVAAPLFHVVASQNQINVLAPNDLPATGTVKVVVHTAAGMTNAFDAEMTEAAPGIFPVREPGSDRVFAAATIANTSWFSIPDSVSVALGLPRNCLADGISPAAVCGQPARPGEAIQIFATGLGRATPGGEPAGNVLPSNQTAPPAGPLYRTVMQPVVRIGELTAQVVFSGLAPGFAGLYQINAVVPAGVVPGDEVPIRLSMPNESSASALIAIRP